MEGTDVRGPTVADAITLSLPTCGPDETVGVARTHLGQSTQVVVVNPAGVILGVMRKESGALIENS
jgi:hypothetical protein